MTEYIDRDCVRKIASMFFTMSMCASEDECRSMNRAIRIIEKRIDSIPAADVVPKDFHERCLEIEIQKRMALERKRGEWINQQADSEMCSACGVRFYISALFAVGGNNEPNYCPNCGALMDKDGDGE